MKHKGLTLIELTIVIVISTIVGLAIGANFLAAQWFRSATEDNIALSREARIGMNHMARVLRFAEPATISAGSDQISATIESEHLDFITSDTNVVYARNTTDKTLEYTQAGESTVVIAGGGERDIDITYFYGTWDGSELEVKLTAQRGDRSISILTKIKPLGE